MSASCRATAPPGRTRAAISATMPAGWGTLTSSSRAWARSKEARGRPVARASPCRTSTLASPGQPHHRLVLLQADDRAARPHPRGEEVEHAPRAAAEVDRPPPRRDAEPVEEPAGRGGKRLGLEPQAVVLGRAVPQEVVLGRRHRRPSSTAPPSEVDQTGTPVADPLITMAPFASTPGADARKMPPRMRATTVAGTNTLRMVCSFLEARARDRILDARDKRSVGTAVSPGAGRRGRRTDRRQSERPVELVPPPWTALVPVVGSSTACSRNSAGCSRSVDGPAPVSSARQTSAARRAPATRPGIRPSYHPLP